MRLPLADFWIAGLDDDRKVVRSHALNVICREWNPPTGALARVMARIDADGWDDAYEFSHQIQNFPHDETSMGWVTERLMRNLEASSGKPDPGLRFLLPWFCKAPVALLEPRIEGVSKAYEAYLAAEGGPLKVASYSGPMDMTLEPAKERIGFASASLDYLEQQLGEAIADCTLSQDFPSHVIGRFDHICEALGKRNGIPAETLEEWLEVDPEEDPEDRDPADDWYAGAAVEILRHCDAPVPLESLINWLIVDWEWMNERVNRMLQERADEALMIKLLEVYPTLEWPPRLYLADVIERARFASCESAVRKLADQEKAPDLRVHLAETLVLYGSPESIDAARAIQRRYVGREEGELTEQLVVHDWLAGDRSRRIVLKLDELERKARRVRAKIEALGDFMDKPEDNAPARSYADLAIPLMPDEKPAVGRNEPCPCGSGKKFKKCCGA
jgi:hypothetical protein